MFIHVEITFSILVESRLNTSVGFVGIDRDNSRIASSSFESEGERCGVEQSVQIWAGIPNGGFLERRYLGKDTFSRLKYSA